MKKGNENHGKCARMRTHQVAFSSGKNDIFFMILTMRGRDKVPDNITQARRVSICTNHFNENCIP